MNTQATSLAFLRQQLGLRVRSARLRRNPPLTLSALARLARLSPALLSKIENAHLTPSLGAVLAIAEALETSVSALVGEAHPDDSEAQHVLDASRTALLVGRSADVLAVRSLIATKPLGLTWRLRLLVMLAQVDHSRDLSEGFLAEATRVLSQVDAAPRAIDPLADLARAEFALVAGEAAWARGETGLASRWWGKGLAVRGSDQGIQSTWTRGLLARSLARVSMGSPAEASALNLAVEHFRLLADPASATRRELAGLGVPTSAALALAVVATAPGAFAEAHSRFIVVNEGRPGGSTQARSDVSLSRHLR